jgi:hypothetical protein
MFLVTLAQARAVVLPVDPVAGGRARSRDLDSVRSAGSIAGRLFCEGSTK